jgi:MobA/MobL family protein
VQIAIHSPEPGHDDRNLHAHLLVSSRGVDEHGMKASKAAEMQDRFMNRAAYTTDLRESWANLANRYLEKFGHHARIDHRSYQKQGLDRAPTLHLGPGDARREREGIRTPAGDYNRGVEERNAQRQRERMALDEAIRQAHAEAAKARLPDDVSDVLRATAASAAADEAHQHRQQAREQEPRDAQQEAHAYWQHAAGSFPADAPGAIAAQKALHSTIEDFARQLSPKYEKALAEVDALEKAQHKVTEDMNYTARRARAADYQADLRHDKLGWFRRVLHDAGIWADTEITRLTTEQKKQEFWRDKNADTLRDVNSQLTQAQRAVEVERARVWDAAMRARREHQTQTLSRLSHRERAEVFRFFDKVYSGGRDLTVADIAHEQSIHYRRAWTDAKTLAKDLDKAEFALRQAIRGLQKTEARIEDRRKALRILPSDLADGRFNDRELHNLVSVERKERLVRDAAEMRVTDTRGRLDIAEKAAHQTFEAARPEAEKELRRRQGIADEARQTFAQMRAEEQQRQRYTHQHRHGMRM